MFLCVYPSVPPKPGMGTPREELGGAPISGSATLATGFNITVTGGVRGAGLGGGVSINRRS